MGDHTSTIIDEVRYCDLLGWDDVHKGVKVEAEYDGATTPTGQWAYMCETHYRRYGIGLGLGMGQRLILKTK
jgi:hypothetical protein